MGLPVVGKAHEARRGEPFVWFVYGSSLDRDAFARWADEHGYRVPDFKGAIVVRLENFRLAFDVRSRFWGGAVASLVEEEGAFVEGIALPVGGDLHALVEHKEGAISGLYAATTVTVTPIVKPVPKWSSEKPRELPPFLRAVAYVAAADRRLPAEEPPSADFIEAVIRGAKSFGLSKEWLDKLATYRP